MLLESFFEKEKRLSDKRTEACKTTNKRKYQESYLNYGFIATGDSHSLSPLYTICGDWLSNKAMKSSQLLCHMKTKHTVLEDKPLEVFKRKREK